MSNDRESTLERTQRTCQSTPTPCGCTNAIFPDKVEGVRGGRGGARGGEGGKEGGCKSIAGR